MHQSLTIVFFSQLYKNSLGRQYITICIFPLFTLYLKRRSYMYISPQLYNNLVHGIYLYIYTGQRSQHFEDSFKFQNIT